MVSIIMSGQTFRIDTMEMDKPLRSMLIRARLPALTMGQDKFFGALSDIYQGLSGSNKEV